MKKIIFTFTALLAIVSLAQTQTLLHSGVPIYEYSGNLGVGTSTPGEKLTLIGNLRIQGVSGQGHGNLQFYRATGHLFSTIGQADLSNSNSTFDFHHYNSNDFRFLTNNTEHLRIKSNGNVGIGINAPLTKLHVNGSLMTHSMTAVGNMHIKGVSGQGHSNLRFYRATGDLFSTIGQADLSNSNSTFDFHHFNSNDFRFLTNNTEHFRIKATGDIGIGTIAPREKLEVNGNALIDGEIYSKKIRISTTPGVWPDYVFDPNYQLPTLAETEAFIKANRHLPEVPSAKEVEKNGQDVGEIQSVLLKKLEEMTLQMIAINKRLEQLEHENKELKKK